MESGIAKRFEEFDLFEGFEEFEGEKSFWFVVFGLWWFERYEIVQVGILFIWFIWFPRLFEG